MGDDRKARKKRAFYAGHKTLPVRILRAGFGPFCCAVVTCILAGAYFAPEGEKAKFQQFFVLGHDREDGLFRSGEQDAYVVFFCICALTVARMLMGKLVFGPLAHVLGVKAKDSSKFTEQGWQVIYYGCAFSMGLHLVSGWNFDMASMWRGYPFVYISWELKAFYLVQMAFWLHMIPVTLCEPWRGDFGAMMAHHFLTSGMVFFSYRINGTPIGAFILAEQDFADIFLPLAKMCKYANWTQVADVIFAIFALAWIPTRHGVFFYIYKHILEMHDHCPNCGVWDEEKEAYLTENIWMAWLVALGAFQVLLWFWLVQLIKAVWKALTSNKQIEDHRSDDSSGADKED